MPLKIKLPLTQFWSEIIKVWCETMPKILSLTVKQWDLATMSLVNCCQVVVVVSIARCSGSPDGAS